MADIHIRNATLDDIDQILIIEESWHEEGRAEGDKFIERIKRYSKGFFVAEIEEQNKRHLIAMVCAMPAIYNPDDLSIYKNWNSACNNGFYFDYVKGNHYNNDKVNSLYIVSGVIDKAYRGGDIFTPMILRVVSLAAQLGLRYVTAGAVMPGYKRYMEKRGSIDAYDYVSRRIGSSLADPFIAMYEKIGFNVPNAAHVKENYFPDDASMNYASLVVRDLSA